MGDFDLDQLFSLDVAHPIAKSSEQLYEKAEEERQRCYHWLLSFLRDNQPKFLTKAELRDAGRCPVFC
jgi:hypothetical protein